MGIRDRPNPISPTSTVCVVLLFKQRNFAVGITFKKTEVIQTVLVGLIVLGEGVSGAVFAALVLGLIGVLLLSQTPGADGAWWRNMDRRTVALGLGSGLLFAVSGVTYRGASLELAMAEPLLRAAVTLAAVTGMQMLGMGLWLMLRDRAEIAAVWAARRTAVWVGIARMLGSLSLFPAFTLRSAAYVIVLGQIELILGLLASALFSKERITARELLGIGVLTGSIVALVLVL